MKNKNTSKSSYKGGWTYMNPKYGNSRLKRVGKNDFVVPLKWVSQRKYK